MVGFFAELSLEVGQSNSNMGDNSEKKIRVNVGRVNEPRKAKKRKKSENQVVLVRVRYVDKKGEMLQKWVTHDDESANHTVVVCGGWTKRI